MPRRNLGVRGAVFDAEGRILLVREAADEGRWSLPGGWVDVNQTPAESVVREVAEESGYRVRVRKLAAVWDKARQGHPPGPFSVVKLYFLCALEGGEARTSLETTEVAWFSRAAVAVRPVPSPHPAAPVGAHVRALARSGTAGRVRSGWGLKDRRRGGCDRV